MKDLSGNITASRHVPKTSRMLFYAIIGFVVAGLAAQGNPAYAAIDGFSIQPTSVDINQAAGTTSTTSLTVTNGLESSATFTVTKEDFAGSSTDASESPILLGGKLETDISGYDWLGITSDAQFSLAPGDSQKVDISVTVPRGATGGHYAAIVIAGPKVEMGSVKAQSRVAVPFYMNGGGSTPPEVNIQNVTETTAGDVVITYVNNGDTHQDATGTVTYIDKVTGRVVSETQAVCSRALPNALGQCIVENVVNTNSGKAVLEEGRVTLVSNDGARSKARLPLRWGGAWKSLLFPASGITLAGAYFGRSMLLRRRRRRGSAYDADLDVDDLL